MYISSLEFRNLHLDMIISVMIRDLVTQGLYDSLQEVL